MGGIAALITGWTACALGFCWLVWRAPEGWEDERGFFLGSPEE